MFKAGSTSLASEWSDCRVSAHVSFQCTPERVATVALGADKRLRPGQVLLLGVFAQTGRTHKRLGAHVARIAALLAGDVVYWHVLCQVGRVWESLAADWAAMWLHMLMIDLHMLSAPAHNASLQFSLHAAELPLLS